MSKFEREPARISRRESIKGAIVVPVGALAVTRWLAGCASDPAPSAGQAVAGASPQTAAAGSNASASASGTGAPPSAAAGAQAAAGRAGSGAPATAAGSSAAGGGGSAAGASGMSAGSGAGAAAPAANGGMAAPTPSAGAAAGAGAGTAGGSAIAGPGVAWASGGTKAMLGPYPDPFAMGMSGPSCKLYPSQTLGPCYTNGPALREDISDGAKGLPVRLSFLVVRASGCTPIPGATVDIWHSGFDGVYSAFASGVCNPDSLDVASQMFCRGVQMTNEQGRADFATIFPGWYSSRSVHLHFTVRVPGMGEKTSQLYFEDALTTEIQAQGEYKARGMRRTTNANDGIFRSGGASAEDVIMLTAKRPDGSLHAWKVLAIG